jgi:hypothetical protein
MSRIRNPLAFGRRYIAASMLNGFLIRDSSEAPPQTADTRKERLLIAAFTFLTALLHGG